MDLELFKGKIRLKVGQVIDPGLVITYKVSL